MRCPSCHASAPDGSRFCPSCGRTLSGTAVSAGSSYVGVTLAAEEVARLASGPAARGSLADPADTADTADTVLGDADDASLRTSGAATGAASGVRADTAPALLFAPGVLIGDRYRIVGPLGRGGMGEVYRASDLRLGQEVALKILPAAFAGDSRRLAQFHSEVRIAREISHPNVCRVYDIGEVDGHLFLSMEYVEGEDLAALLRRAGRLPEPQAIDLARQICAGLAAVHERGVLHRDLKPANIMLSGDDGRARLMDFGLAAGSGVEHAREGTPAYMAPEQLLGEPLTVRSDLYALGLVMHEMFTGQPAFDAGAAGSLRDLVTQRTTASAAALPQRASGLNPSVERAIHQCLQRDQAQRPSTAHAVSAMLQIVLLDASTTARRLLQVGLPVVGALLLSWGSFFALRGTGTIQSIGVGLAILGAILLAAAMRHSLWWNIDYKGHRIRFQNHAFFGERLYIDGALVDRGRPGIRCTLRGTIEAGEGAGERITAESRAGLLTFSCRIIAESFSATPRGT